MFTRIIKKELKQQLFNGKIFLLTGPRQTGKTTLIEEFIQENFHKDNYKSFNCDDPADREFLNDRNLVNLKALIGPAKIIFIDEGQKVPTIGQTLKLLVDHFKKEKHFFVSGSSSINLLSETMEPLTGRKTINLLYPICVQEAASGKDFFMFNKGLENCLIYGMYPDVVNQTGTDLKKQVLKELTTSYLFKDIYEFQQIKNPAILFNLLKALALQIGSEVSYNELSGLLGIDKKTVEKYIDLLEKNYIIVRLDPFARNLRKAITKLRKIFFLDNGIRNAVLNNFNPLTNRTDTGMLWENFLISERLKYQHYNKLFSNNYFWRTYDGAEIDFIEEFGGELHAFEFKFNEKRKSKIPDTFKEEYPQSHYKIINRENYFNWLVP